MYRCAVCAELCPGGELLKCGLLGDLPVPLDDSLLLDEATSLGGGSQKSDSLRLRDILPPLLSKARRSSRARCNSCIASVSLRLACFKCNCSVTCCEPLASATSPC